MKKTHFQALRFLAMAATLTTALLAKPGKAGMDFVSGNWLKKNASSVILIDARPPAEYAAGHIPGAINITWQMLSNMKPKQGEPGWAVILDKMELEKKLGSLGIHSKKPVVVYCSPLGAGLGEEGRVHWSLDIAGLKNVKLLDGGFMKWQATGRPISKEATTLPAASFTISHYDHSLIATTEHVKQRLGKAKLLDTRSPEEFRGVSNHGENLKGKPALGHIKGSIPFCFSNLYRQDGTFCTRKEMQAIFQKQGLRKGDEIITYCTAGIRSGMVCQMLRHCGYRNVKNYNASFSEWVGQGLPFVKE